MDPLEEARRFLELAGASGGPQWKLQFKKGVSRSLEALFDVLALCWLDAGSRSGGGARDREAQNPPAGPVGGCTKAGPPWVGFFFKNRSMDVEMETGENLRMPRAWDSWVEYARYAGGPGQERFPDTAGVVSAVLKLAWAYGLGGVANRAGACGALGELVRQVESAVEGFVRKRGLSHGEGGALERLRTGAASLGSINVKAVRERLEELRQRAGGNPNFGFYRATTELLSDALRAEWVWELVATVSANTSKGGRAWPERPVTRRDFPRKWRPLPG